MRQQPKSQRNILAEHNLNEHTTVPYTSMTTFECLFGIGFPDRSRKLCSHLAQSKSSSSIPNLDDVDLHALGSIR